MKRLTLKKDKNKPSKGNQNISKFFIKLNANTENDAASSKASDNTQSSPNSCNGDESKTLTKNSGVPAEKTKRKILEEHTSNGIHPKRKPLPIVEHNELTLVKSGNKELTEVKSASSMDCPNLRKLNGSSTSNGSQILESEVLAINDILQDDLLTSLNTAIVPSKCETDIKKQVRNEEQLKSVYVEDLEDIFNSSHSLLEENFSLDLTTSKRCKVYKISQNSLEITLTLQSVKGDLFAKCILKDFWIHMRLSVGKILHVMAVREGDVWTVTNSKGLVVYEPDLLISTTSVVGSVFCKRRSVLSEKYRGCDPSNKIMIIGILLHRMLQDVLQNNLRTEREISDLIANMVEAKDVIWMLYECQLSKTDVFEELSKFVPKILLFLNQYINETSENNKSTKSKAPNNNWKGKIDKIEDIEENIWCPSLGLKGKVDVSVESKGITMPLELKTGRATMSLEHRGQVLLYLMMMKTVGYNVDSGLVLYLRENVMGEIPLNQKDARDLILLRNELVYYLTSSPSIKNYSVGISGENIIQYELPEPINHHSACAKCSYNLICCAHLKYNKTDLKYNKALESVQHEVLAHLDDIHLEYFMKWGMLLGMEDSRVAKDRNIQDIYILAPEKREKKGNCIANVVLHQVNSLNNGTFEHTFKARSGSNIQNSNLQIQSYTVVSTATRPAVATGFITYIDNDTILLELERDLRKRYSGNTFHLDTFTSASAQLYNYTNLSLLLNPTERAEQLRKLIIEKTPPTFQIKLPKLLATKGASILKKLDQTQQRAVLKAISANDYLLIKGMPGTGKTTTIVALIQLLLLLNKTVLLTSHTHSAVDNVCLKLRASNIGFLRLGSSSKIDSKLEEFSEKFLIRDCTKPEELDQLYSNAKIIAVTCLGAVHPCLDRVKLDYCIVDESTQVIQCSVFRALLATSKFILIGDPHQLCPVVKSDEARLAGLSESLFERLDGVGATALLSYNYRMNKTITEVANAVTYNGLLMVANNTVGNGTLRFSNHEKFLEKYKEQEWIIKSLDTSLANAVQVLDTGHDVDQNRVQNFELLGSELQKCCNTHEASIVVALVTALKEAGISPESIGVIAPYRAQVSLLITKLEDKEINVNTVDQYQGKDKDIILYSCTKTFKRSDIEYEILEDNRRLTVALTRAKVKLIIIGDIETISSYSPFSRLFNSLDKNRWIHLKNGEMGFDWNNIMY